MRRWDGTEWVTTVVPSGGGTSASPMALTDLTDVDAIGANPDDALVKDVDGIWRPKLIEGGGTETPVGEWVLVGTTIKSNTGTNIGSVVLPAHEPGDVLVISCNGISSERYAYPTSDDWQKSYGGMTSIAMKTATSFADGNVPLTVSYNNSNYPLIALAASFRFIGATGDPVIQPPAVASEGYVNPGRLVVLTAVTGGLQTFSAAPEGFALAKQGNYNAYSSLTSVLAWGMSAGALNDITFTYGAGTVEAARIATATGV